MYCLPSPAAPPSPNLTNCSRVENGLPGSGFIMIAERMATLRVCGVGDCFSARSHEVATSMLNCQVSGAFGSEPPITPVASSFGALNR